jgi:Domain of unknown function (DUF4386)
MSTMNSDRKAAAIAGWLYILGTVAGVLSVAYAVDAPDYLVQAATNANQVLLAAFFHLVMTPAYVGIAIALYPVLRPHHPHLALGFASFRVMAGAFIFIGVIFLLLILALSQEYVRAGAPAASYFQTLGMLLQAGRDLVNHIAMILAVSLGGLMYYWLLYQSQLVPRWLSGWGLLGTTLTIVATLLVLFRLIGILTTGYMVLNLPIAMQEMVLAVWLIVKGFNPPTADAAG